MKYIGTTAVIVQLNYRVNLSHDRNPYAYKFVFWMLPLRFIEDRYKYMCEVAQSRAILSLGISCFKQKKSKTNKDSKNKESEGILNIRVKTFNIVALCTENFVVEPASLKFLVGHGFDFNKQYAKGVPYTRGDDKASMHCNLVFRLLAVPWQANRENKLSETGAREQAQVNPSNPWLTFLSLAGSILDHIFAHLLDSPERDC